MNVLTNLIATCSLLYRFFPEIADLDWNDYMWFTSTIHMYLLVRNERTYVPVKTNFIILLLLFDTLLFAYSSKHFKRRQHHLIEVKMWLLRKPRVFLKHEKGSSWNFSWAMLKKRTVFVDSEQETEPEWNCLEEYKETNNTSNPCLDVLSFFPG